MPKRIVDWEAWAYSKVDRSGGPDACWPWLGAIRKNDGYGWATIQPVTPARVGWAPTSSVAHRVVWQILVGPIPDGLILDHDCHNRDLTCPGGKSCLHRRCINLAHLRLTDTLGNLSASTLVPSSVNRVKTHCPYGHPYAGANLVLVKARNGRQERQCRSCGNQRCREWYARKNK